MPEDEGELTLAPVAGETELEALVSTVFCDPQTRRGMGWTERDDPEEAMQAIGGLWHRRLDEGWSIFDVQRTGETIGLAGLGPIEEGRAWWAVYLLERGQGLGKAIGRRLIDRAAEDGAREVVAVTWAKNEASRGMLSSLGFEAEGPPPYDWARESELAWLRYRRELA